MINTLSLPAFGNVPGSYMVRRKAEGLVQFADLLARADVLLPRHWHGDLANACTAALTELTDRLHPHQPIPLHLSFTDMVDLGSTESYCWRNHIKEKTRHLTITHAHEPIGGFLVHMTTVMQNGPQCYHLGEVLQEMEEACPRLGQTVLLALQRGLNKSCRALTPRNGLDWVQMTYWGGEEDESMRLEEELDSLMYDWDHLPAKEKKKTPKPTEADVSMFRLKDYNEAFPAWVIADELHPFSPSALQRKAPRRFAHAANAAAAILRWLARPRDLYNDCGHFEQSSMDMCPYLIRWEKGDPLSHIWDAVMEDYSNTGDTAMDVNAIFAFHTEHTFRRALRRLTNYLELLTLTETLLLILDGERHVRIPVRV